MRQRDLKVNFTMEVKQNGKVSKSTMLAVAKAIMPDNRFRTGEWFVTDAQNECQLFDVQKGDDGQWCITCEVADDDRDYYNCLYLGKGKNKAIKAEGYEGWKV